MFLRLVISFLVLSLPVSAQVTEKSRGNEKKHKGLTLDQFRKVSGISGPRSVSIQPVQPASGIETGNVVAYGQVIPPPYRVEYVGRRILINSVQVSPSLVKERHQSEHPQQALPPNKKKIQDSAGELMIAVKKIYEDGQSSESKDSLHKKILLVLGKHSDVILNPVWHGEELCYTTSVYQFSQCTAFGSSMRTKPALQAENERKNRAERVAQIEAELRAGRWLYFGSMGGMAVRKDASDEINKIMGDTKLSKDQRIEFLKETALDDYDLALDIADNYKASEWRKKKK
jgi:hypothetical protein